MTTISVKEQAEALVAQADALRGKLLEERKQLLVEIAAIDEILAKLPGASLHPSPVSMEEWRIRKRVLQATEVGRQGAPINSRDILHVVAVYYGFKTAELRGTARHASVSHARHVAMYVARKLTAESFPELAESFGGRDHTTVIAAVRKIEEKMSEDAELGDEVSAIEGAVREAQAMRSEKPVLPTSSESGSDA